MEFIETKLRGNGAGDFFGIAGQHHRFGYACRMQVGDGFSRIVFHHVGDNNMTQIFSVFGNMQHRSDKFAIVSINIKACHEFVVADAHTRAVDFSLHAAPAYLACVRHARLVDAGAIRLLYRHCDGMV